MPKQESQTSKSNGTDTPMSPFGLNVFDSAVAAPYARAGQAFMESALAMNQELMRFAGERFQNDVATFQALCECKSWQDAIALQSDYFKSTTEAYQLATKKLWEQGTQTNAEITESLRNAVTTLPDAAPGADKER